MTCLSKTIALTFAASVALAVPSSAQEKTFQDIFKEECSACHLAYPAYFLPKRSWKAIMATLPDHFGEDASLDEESRKKIEVYLETSAADRPGRNPRWLKKIPANVIPMRISELSWFKHEHGKRTEKYIAANPSIGSIANCQACHKGAERGYFDD